jgi:hypothetical protein
MIRSRSSHFTAILQNPAGSATTGLFHIINKRLILYKNTICLRLYKRACRDRATRAQRFACTPERQC